MTELVRAGRAELPALTALWSACFGDSTETVEGFWARLLPQAAVFAAKVDGLPVSMLCALPTQWITDDGQTVPAAYLYAVCTAPAHRGRGLCRALISYAEKALQADGIGLAYLSPAGKGLFDFYRALGYSEAFSRREYTVSAEKHPCKITRLAPSAYRNLREMQLYGNCISVGEALIDWLRFGGAELYHIETAQSVCCAAAIRNGGTTTLVELLPDVPEAAETLCAALNVPEARICVPGEAVPCGMAKALSKNAALPQYAYLGPDFG